MLVSWTNRIDIIANSVALCDADSVDNGKKSSKSILEN